MTRSRLSLISVLVVGCLTLGACGSDDDEPEAAPAADEDTTTPAGAAPADVDAPECPLTAVDVAEVIGEEMDPIEQSRVGSGCGFEPTADPIGGPQVIWRTQSNLALESFGPDQGGETVDGLGDEAVCLEDLGSTSAVVRVGEVVFEVQVIADDIPCDLATALAEVATQSPG